MFENETTMELCMKLKNEIQSQSTTWEKHNCLYLFVLKVLLLHGNVLVHGLLMAELQYFC